MFIFIYMLRMLPSCSYFMTTDTQIAAKIGSAPVDSISDRLSFL